MVTMISEEHTSLKNSDKNDFSKRHVMGVSVQFFSTDASHGTYTERFSLDSYTTK